MESTLVLVADDQEDSRLLYVTHLEASGFRVVEAVNGDEALEQVGREVPDAVVMDLTMPGVDGWEATHVLKSNPRTKNVIVVIVTANALPDDLARARAAGADEVCTKPCLPEDLLRRLRPLLARRGRR